MQSPSASVRSSQGPERQPTRGVKRLSRFHPYTHDPRGKYDPAGQHNPYSSLPHSCSLTSLLYATLPCTLPTPHHHHEEQSTFLEKPLGSEPAPPFECEAPVEWTDTDRSEYARCLIDSAVETLSAKWYMTSLRDFPKVLQFMRNPDGTISLPKSLQQAANGVAHMGDIGPRYPYQSTHEHMPLRQFLHEVLRRSRTSCTVLQVALCYVEAVAVKLPRVMDDEVRRVEQYNVAALMADPTMPLASVATAVTMLPGMGDTDPTAPAGQLAPPLPSPLLCPRRTFLAALLLASKFMQDRSYSNKAWGKLTGLSPREVSRCERALAEALEWRLWVGHTELLPRGFKDDGAPVVSGDATFSAELVEPAASEPVIAAIEEHIRRTMDIEGSGAHRRASRARSLPDIASIPRRNLAALQASARTQTWVNTLPQNLPSIPPMFPVGAKTPVIDPTPFPPPLTATLVDHFPNSGSPPESLVHTQSSVESFASFSEVSTPPDSQDLPAPPAVFMKTGMAMENHGMQLAMLGLGVDAGIPAILPEIPLVDYVGGAGGRY